MPWLSLLAVSASLAYAMNGAVVRGVPAINLATADATNAVRREESDAFRYADRSVLPTSGNLVGDSDSDSCGRGQDVVVTITYRDTSTGRDLQMRCVSTSDRLGRNDLVVSAESMRDISAFLSALCDPE